MGDRLFGPQGRLLSPLEYLPASHAALIDQHLHHRPTDPPIIKCPAVGRYAVAVGRVEYSLPGADSDRPAPRQAHQKTKPFQGLNRQPKGRACAPRPADQGVAAQAAHQRAVCEPIAPVSDALQHQPLFARQSIERGVLDQPGRQMIVPRRPRRAGGHHFESLGLQLNS